MDVFFDEIEVHHERLVWQENAYYPFGLGIKPLEREGVPGHRWTHMGIEREEATGWDETYFRPYDSQTGRFHHIDPLAPLFSGITPYQYAFNNPILFNDRSGLRPQSTAELIEQAWNATGENESNTFSNNGDGTFTSEKYKLKSKSHSSTYGNLQDDNAEYDIEYELVSTTIGKRSEAKGDIFWSDGVDLGNKILGSSLDAGGYMLDGLKNTGVAMRNSGTVINNWNLTAKGTQLANFTGKAGKVLGRVAPVIGGLGVITKIYSRSQIMPSDIADIGVITVGAVATVATIVAGAATAPVWATAVGVGAAIYGGASLLGADNYIDEVFNDGKAVWDWNE